jgi:hypothetical protein
MSRELRANTLARGSWPAAKKKARNLSQALGLSGVILFLLNGLKSDLLQDLFAVFLFHK